jgi:hypothetical protein
MPEGCTMKPLPAALYGGGVVIPTTAGAAALAALTTLQYRRKSETLNSCDVRNVAATCRS